MSPLHKGLLGAVQDCTKFDRHMRHTNTLNEQNAEIFCTPGVSKLFMTKGQSGYSRVVRGPHVDM